MVNECVAAGCPKGPSQQVSLLALQRSGQGWCRELELVGIQQTIPHFVVNILLLTALMPILHMLIALV